MLLTILFTVFLLIFMVHAKRATLTVFGYTAGFIALFWLMLRLQQSI
jgi:hypothetical protein